MKAFIYSFLICFFSFQIGFTQTWDKVMNFGEYDVAIDVIQTPDGGFAILLDPTYIVKVDQNGFIQWAKNLDEAPNVYGTFSIQLNENSELLIGGTYLGNGRDIGFVKLDLNGNYLGLTTLNRDGDQNCRDFLITNNGSFFFTGLEQNPNGNSDFTFVAKIDNENIQDWFNVIEDITYNPYHMYSTESLAGGFLFGGKWNYEPIGNNAAIMKINEDGEMVWIFQPDPNDSYNPITSIVESKDSSIYCTGFDRTLRKLDFNGNLIWEKLMVFSQINSLIISNDTTLVMTGRVGRDLLILKTDMDGKYIWHKNYGECELDQNLNEINYNGKSIIQTSPDMGYLVTGHKGYYNPYLIKVDSLGNSIVPSQSSYHEIILCPGEWVSINENTYYSFDEEVYYEFLNFDFDDGLCDSLIAFRVIEETTTEFNFIQINCQNEPFYYLEDTLTQEGIYEYVLEGENQYGCDSIITLNFFYGPETYSYQNIQICEGEQYIIDNEAFSQTGSYSIIIENSNQYGCDSIINLNLEVLQFVENDLWIELCQGETFSVGNQTFDESGDYQITLITEIGCDSIINLSLEVFPEYEIDLNEEICQGESFILSGQTFTESGNFEINLASQSGCDSIINLNLNVLPSIETYLNEQICEEETIIVGGQTFSETGEYEILLTSIETGCDSIIYLTLTSSPDIIVNQEEIICPGDSIQIEENYYSIPGDYIFEYVSAVGCDSIVTLTIENFQSITVTDTIIINDDGSGNGVIAINLDGGSPPFEFNWSNGSTSQNLQNLEAGEYGLTINDSNNCQSEFHFEVGLVLSASSYATQINEINIYPTPVKLGDRLFIQFQKEISNPADISIFDIAGKKVDQAFIEKLNSENRIELTAFSPPGVYLIIVQERNSGNMWSGKFVII